MVRPFSMDSDLNDDTTLKIGLSNPLRQSSYGNMKGGQVTSPTSEVTPHFPSEK